MKLVIASDHAGVEMKSSVVQALEADGHEVTDLGTHDARSCDYPDYAVDAARRVVAGQCEMGILICGTGVGMAVSANKVAGIRAAAVSEPVSAALARSHNDANVICFGARIVGPEVALEIVRAFLATPFSHGVRHERRVAKMNGLDAGR